MDRAPILPASLRRGLGLSLFTLTLAGCSYGITVRQVSDRPLLAAWQASVTANEELSERTLQTLRRLDLLTLYRSRPAEAVARVHAFAVDHATPDLLFALAEMSYVLGRHAEKQESSEAVVCYYHCAGYAYHYLFDPRPEDQAAFNSVLKTQPDQLLSAFSPQNPDPNPLTLDLRPRTAVFDPRFRLACDLYNAALAKCIRAAQRSGRLDPRHVLHLPCPDGHEFALSVTHTGFAWSAEEFGPLLFCADYQVIGLDNQFRGYGLGVPLIGTRLPTASASDKQAHYPRNVSFPVTAIFRFEGSLADLGAQRCGRLELYNPLHVQRIQVAEYAVPLETDLTTPLAFFLSKTDLEEVELRGFFRPDSLRNRTGIYLFEPYQPGKIPVVMVHGLLSSPLTWTPLFNELQGDPAIRKNYQFWFYLYPTGDPYLETAADLHQVLQQLRSELDPQGRDPALGKMVLVGHSMGGLVSKLMTIRSGDTFWRLVSKEPFEDLKGAAADRDELRRVFFFEEDPAVKRVIFLGTPHHGSKLSPSLPARLLASFIRLPRRLVTATSDLARENPGFRPGSGKTANPELPTSIDLLTPGAPALELLAAERSSPAVHYHSIIGVAFGEGKAGSDGVVPYASAHIDGVDSEVVVPADHFHVHQHPGSMLEVRRILLEHARAVRSGNDGIIQVGHGETGQPDKGAGSGGKAWVIPLSIPESLPTSRTEVGPPAGEPWW
jgi:pimeloyl-ACP methyl ester carboxylesterase